MNHALEIANLAEKVIQRAARDSLPISKALADVFGCEEWSLDFMLALAAVQTKTQVLAQAVEGLKISARPRSVYVNAVDVVRTLFGFPAVVTQPVVALLNARKEIETLHVLAAQLPDDDDPQSAAHHAGLVEDIDKLADKVRRSAVSEPLQLGIIRQLNMIGSVVGLQGRIDLNGALALLGAKRSRAQSRPRKSLLGRSRTRYNRA